MSEVVRGLTELVERTQDRLKRKSFGLDYLDDALVGIRPSELVIIAGRTGVGKTELGVHIARLNAQKSKVLLVALEAESQEVERRIKYQLIANKYFAHRADFSGVRRLSFTEWLHAEYGDNLDVLEHWASENLKPYLGNLEIFSPEIAQFKKSDFCLIYEDAAKRGCELVILDHLHYISPEDRENEYDHMKQVMWKLRDLINRYRVPLVAFSHLRKESRKDDTLVPTLEDLHGSSEISKQANHVIAFAPCYSVPSRHDPKVQINTLPGSTFCRILKTRTGHIGADRYVALLNFDLESKSYKPGYVPYACDKFAYGLTALNGEQEFEPWMEGHARLAGA